MMAIIFRVYYSQISLQILDFQFIIYYNPLFSVYLTQALPHYQAPREQKLVHLSFRSAYHITSSPHHPSLNLAGLIFTGTSIPSYYFDMFFLRCLSSWMRDPSVSRKARN